MKIKTVLLAACITFASADFFSVSAGGGYERQNISGYVKNSGKINYFNNPSAQSDLNPNTGDLGLDDKSNPYFWVKLIHPLPFIPNIKFQYTRYDTSGYSTYIAGGVKIFGDVNIPTAITNAKTSQSIDSYDLTLFYEFKPLIADIEAGAGVDYWKGESKIEGSSVVESSWSVPLPYLYAHIETLNIYGFSFLGSVKFAKIGDNHHYDYEGALKYTIDIIGPVNPFVKIGYRYKDVYGVDSNDETSLKYKGAYLEIGAKF